MSATSALAAAPAGTEAEAVKAVASETAPEIATSTSEPIAAAETAVGVAWLGAAGVRLASLALDRPKTSWPFWAYLGAEIVFGATALASARRR